MLLPKEVNEEGEEEDPRAELVMRLLEYKKYRLMSEELKDRLVSADIHHSVMGSDHCPVELVIK